MQTTFRTNLEYIGTMAVGMTGANITGLMAEGKSVALDFWATWRGFCQTIGLMTDELAEGFNGKITIDKVNTGENSDLPNQYGIRSILTILSLKGGEMASKFVGAQNKVKL